MTRADVEHALSMVFPDVRLKSYVEIRPADSMPVPYAIAYAALVKGLFYWDENLESLEAACAQIGAEDVWRAKEASFAAATAPASTDAKQGKLADELFDMARKGLTTAIAPHEKDLLDPLASLVAARTTLADLS